MDVRKGLEEKGLVPSSAELGMVPKNASELDIEKARRVLKFIDALEDNDDVQEVYTNLDIPDDLLEELSQ